MSGNGNGACPSEADLSALWSGVLSPFLVAPVQAHVDSCPACKGVVDALGRTSSKVLDVKRLPFGDEQACVAALARAISPGQAHGLPRTLDRYELIEELGRGGMGVVFKARHGVVKADSYAIKLLPPDVAASSQGAKRFVLEMKALGELRHDNLVKAIDAGESGGELFLVMEFVDGPDLGKLARQTRLTWEKACGYVLQAARGLEHLHAHRFVHRDVKPSNLLLAPNGVVKVSDLGLVLRREGTGKPHVNDGLTAMVRVLGTMGYAAPEQLASPHDVTERADVYSLGCTLTTLLGGRLPGHLPDDVPVAVREIVRRMTDPDPERRHASATDVILELEAVLGTRPVVIALVGTKGGVGKGTLVNFMAQILADSGNNVAVVDYDLGNYSSTAHATSWYKRPQNTPACKTVFDHFAPNALNLNYVSSGTDPDLWDVTPASLSSRGRSQVWMVPALRMDGDDLIAYEVIANIPADRRERVAADVTAEIVRRVCSRHPVGFVLIDCGAGTNPIYSAAMSEATYCFIVTSPDPEDQKRVKQIKDQYARYYPAKPRTIHAVVNEVISELHKATSQAVNPLGFIPYDPLLQLDTFSGKAFDVGQAGEPRANPWDALGDEYELGYGQVQQAVHDLLRKALIGEHRRRVRDALEIRSGWVQVPAAARERLAHPWYRRVTTAGRAIAAALAVTLAGCALWATVDPGAAAFGCVAVAFVLALAAGVWLARHEGRRVTLRRVAAWAELPPASIREKLAERLQTASRPARKWLYELTTPPKATARAFWRYVW